MTCQPDQPCPPVVECTGEYNSANYISLFQGLCLNSFRLRSGKHIAYQPSLLTHQFVTLVIIGENILVCVSQGSAIVCEVDWFL